MRSLSLSLMYFVLSAFSASLTPWQSALAGPYITLCIAGQCNPSVRVAIGDSTWNEVKALFDTPIMTDKDEQDNIASAVGLIEADVYQRLLKQPLEHTASFAKQSQEIHLRLLYDNNSRQDHLKNIKQIIGLLLDQHLVTRHYLRGIHKSADYLGLYHHYGLLLQSHDTSQLFMLHLNRGQDTDTHPPGLSPVIVPYQKRHAGKARQTIILP